MGLGYSAKILEHFHRTEDPGREHARGELAERCAALTRAISTETADFLADAIRLVELHAGDRDRLMREAVLLGLRIARADRRRHEQLDVLYEDMEAFGLGQSRPALATSPTRKLLQVAHSVALSASLAMWGTACNSCGGPGQVMPVDPVPADRGGVTPNNNDNARRPPPDFPPPDPPPPDRPMLVDPVPMPIDPPRPPEDDAERRPDNGPGRRRPPPPPPPPDPLPRPMPPVDPPPPPRPIPPLPPDPLPPPMPRPPVVDPLPSPKSAKLVVIDQWRDTSAPGARRSTDMPFHRPPSISLDARRDGGRVIVRLVGGDDAMSIRWEGAEGPSDEQREVTWMPSSPFDQLRVAVRTEGGVAITSVRARMI